MIGRGLRALRSWYRARLRAYDIKVLWPTCKELAPSLSYAKAAFAAHAFADPAWRDELDVDALCRFIEELR